MNGQLVNIGNTDSEKNYSQKIENIAFEEYCYTLNLERLIANALENKFLPFLIN